MEDVWIKIINEPEKIRFKQADYYSPYCETVADAIKKQPDGTSLININAFYRYDDIFQMLLQGEENQKEKDYLYDIFMHFMTRLELKNGLTRREFALRKAWYEIEHGDYGKVAKELFALLSDDEKYVIAHGVTVLDDTGENVLLFSKILLNIIGSGVVYRNQLKKRELLLYTGRELERQEADKITLVKEMFLPFEYSLRIFDEQSFGVIDNELSMNLNDMVLF